MEMFWTFMNRLYILSRFWKISHLRKYDNKTEKVSVSNAAQWLMKHLCFSDRRWFLKDNYLKKNKQWQGSWATKLLTHWLNFRKKGCSQLAVRSLKSRILTYILSKRPHHIRAGIYKRRVPHIFHGSNVASRLGYNWCHWSFEHSPCNKPAQAATWESSERKQTYYMTTTNTEPKSWRSLKK